MAMLQVKWETKCNRFLDITVWLFLCVQSEDSMEHLSAEERACLMYLEETIEALEVQEDSGLSNDEPDPGHLAEKMGQRRVEGKYKCPLMSLNILFAFFSELVMYFS